MKYRTNGGRSHSTLWKIEDMVSPRNKLYRLANVVRWSDFEKSFFSSWADDDIVERLPIRLMTGLLMVKHMRRMSDEGVLCHFVENPYIQYFCGNEYFAIEKPCNVTELTDFRHSIGDQGLNLIAEEIFRVSDMFED